jgi:hypothetical protein
MKFEAQSKTILINTNRYKMLKNSHPVFNASRSFLKNVIFIPPFLTGPGRVNVFESQYKGERSASGYAARKSTAFALAARVIIYGLTLGGCHNLADLWVCHDFLRLWPCVLTCY